MRMKDSILCVLHVLQYLSILNVHMYILTRSHSVRRVVVRPYTEEGTVRNVL